MSEPPAATSVLQKTARGAGWIIAWRAVTRGLGFVNTLVLARLLVPADFGVVALAMSFSQAIDALVNFGVQDAVVRAQNPTKAFYDTAFTLNAIRSATTALLLAVTAPEVATFFAEPRLTNILYVLAGSVLLGGLENIGIADFRRDFAFHNEFQLWVFPRVAQVIVTVGTALVWPSYWALVIGILTARLLRNVSGYTMHSYRPHCTLTEWRQIFSFSLWTWLIGLVGLVRSRLTVVTIARLLGPTMLGVYSLGAELASLPETELVDPICRVSFSSFSAIQRSGAALNDAYLRIIATTLTVTLPFGVGMAITAHAIVPVMFGPNWSAATPVVQVLAITALFNVVGRISVTLFSAHAYLRSLFGVSLTMLFVQLALLLVLVWQWGLLGAAFASAAVNAVEQVVYSVLTFRKLKLRPEALLRLTWRGLFATAAMTSLLMATGIGQGPNSATVGHLLITSASGGVVYVAALLGAWLACGRPAGAETDLLAIAGQGIQGLRSAGSRAYHARSDASKLVAAGLFVKRSRR